MIRVKNILHVVYAVHPESFKKWGWFWQEGMGGRLTGKAYMAPTNKDWGSVAWTFDLGTFNVEILAGLSRERASPIEDFVNTHGDHSVRKVLFEVDDPTHFVERNPEFQADASRRGIRFVVPEPKRSKGGQSEFAPSRWVKKLDHITFALTPDMMEHEAEFWVSLGGKLQTKTDDLLPKNLSSSMMLWCLDFGTFGIALVAGLDREEKSQVTAFTDRHGSLHIQHVAYGMHNLEQFCSHLREDLGGNLMGDILTREDNFRPGETIKQVFGAGFDTQDPAEATFPEFMERPDMPKSIQESTTFSLMTGGGLHAQVEAARASGEKHTLVDFSRMPEDWEP